MQKLRMTGFAMRPDDAQKAKDVSLYLGYRSFSKFVRDAIAEKLERELAQSDAREQPTRDRTCA
jgi:hypothetical protein